MIIKGKSRAGPSQLARHLERADTNERVAVLEMQSPAPNLTEAFRDWQALSEGTRGDKGLYHANIDPAETYRMTPEQWTRAVDVLEQELGLQGQPRAVVLHEKHGREHIHVVWARTDIDTMRMRSDSQNYQAHERASHQLEVEFGHEIVPGKHQKRDRQQDMPTSEISHAEWQQSERSGLDPRDRKEQITGLFQASDSAPAFRAALEDAGYVLARGDRRDFVLIDQVGEVHSLGRQIKGIKAADLREFMAGVDREALPDIATARDQQRDRDMQPEPTRPLDSASANADERLAAEDRRKAQEREKAREPAPEPPRDPAAANADERLAAEDRRNSQDRAKAREKAEPPRDPAPMPDATVAEAARMEARAQVIREAALARRAEGLAEQEKMQGGQIDELQKAQAAEASREFEKMAREQAARAAAERAEPTGMELIWRQMREGISAAALKARLDREAGQAAARDRENQHQIRMMVAGLEVKHRQELTQLAERQGQERADLMRAQAEELARHLAEDARARALELEYERRQAEALDRDYDGRGPPDRAR